MNRIRVQLFAAAREAAGRDWVEVDVPGPITATRLKALLLEQYPPLRSLAQTAQLAVNQQFVGPQHLVHPQDEVAWILPVSGG